MAEVQETINKFVETACVKKIVSKALNYLRAGFPVHFCGPAGTGKTTLALHTAKLLERPITLIHGNDEFTNTDLVGGNFGLRRKKIVDNYIHSVWKGEESLDSVWYDGRLTRACRQGDTLVYDEFTRSRPEANNVLLAVLEERILDLSQFQKGEQLLNVHPEFSAIFTSNPEEYAGVYKFQDALKDRLITIDLSYYDEETETAIAAVKSGLPKSEVAKIVKITRNLRCSAGISFTPSIRATIMIAKLCRGCKANVSNQDQMFREICLDVLMSEAARGSSQAEKSQLRKTVEDLIDLVC